MFLYFLQGAALALPSTFTPSPFKVLLITQALQHGFRRAAPIVLVPLITDGPIILLAVFLLTQVPSMFLDLLRIAGALFLFYLAARLLHRLLNPGPELQANAEGKATSIGQAVLINLLNPNPYILWGVVAGPILLQGLRDSTGSGLSFVIGFYATFIVGLLALVLAFATAGRLDPRLNKALIAISALGMGYIAVNQLIMSVRSLAGQ